MTGDSVAAAVPPHEPVDSPWSFQRLNEHGHVAIRAAAGTADASLDGAPLPLPSHARVHLSMRGTLGGVIGTAVVYPDGRVEGVVTDQVTGSRLIRHVGFSGITVTHSTVEINDEELGP